jgi:hypothetical protein
MIGLIATVHALGCRANPRDDAFARRFIDNVRRDDSAGALQLQPNSVISDSGWIKIVRIFQPTMPRGVPDTVRIIEWENGTMPTMGAYRKLTYEVQRADTASKVQLWLVGPDSQTYVSALKIGLWRVSPQ